MMLLNSFSAVYHYYANEGEPIICAKLGGAADFAPYTVVDIGPFTIFNLTPEQLRKLATVCSRAADKLEQKYGQQHNTEAAEQWNR